MIMIMNSWTYGRPLSLVLGPSANLCWWYIEYRIWTNSPFAIIYRPKSSRFLKREFQYRRSPCAYICKHVNWWTDLLALLNEYQCTDGTCSYVRKQRARPCKDCGPEAPRDTVYHILKATNYPEFALYEWLEVACPISNDNGNGKRGKGEKGGVAPSP